MKVNEMKTLLLNHACFPLSFLSWKRVVRLVVKDKVFVDHYWDHEIPYNGGNSSFKLPAVIRLKNYVPFHIKRRRYNRAGVFKRDGNTCQYCGKMQRANLLTIDHIVPRANGGQTSWENCVACCFDCNNKKSSMTLKKSGMKLLNGRPRVPRMAIWHDFTLMSNKHKGWKDYFHGMD